MTKFTLTLSDDIPGRQSI